MGAVRLTSTRPPLSLLLLCLIVLTVLSACSSPSSLSPFENSTPAPLHAQLSIVPAAPGGRAYQDSTLVVSLDAYPDPATAHFGTVTLRSAGLAFDANVRTDLVGRAVILTPAKPLVAESTYELLVTTEVRSLDGRALPQTAAFTVQVADGMSPPDPSPSPSPSPSPLTWANDIGPTLGVCSPYCHAPVDIDGNRRNPTRSLDLTGDIRDPVRGLVNVESVGQALAGQPMLRVAPFDSANSVLLRKLLGGEPPPGRRTAAYPEMHVVGQRMPLDIDTMTTGIVLTKSFIAKVEQWIDQGAP